MENQQFKLFLATGILNTIFGYVLFTIFIYFEFNYPVAVLLATILGILFNFKTIGKFVFSAVSTYSKFIKFILVYTFIYTINICGLWVLEKLHLENKYLAGLVLVLPLALISFHLNKKYVFLTTANN
jgi:putative flippase GtrA